MYPEENNADSAVPGATDVLQAVITGLPGAFEQLKTS
jgi:hypothetical protein